MKKVEDSKTELIHLVRYQHLNGHRRLFGGILMQWIDELAGIVAGRHCGGGIITAAVDQLIFRQPAYLNDVIMMTGYITYVGNTSMEVRIDTHAETFGGERRLINTAYLVMVAVDENDSPKAVPKLELTNNAQRHEWEQAEKRKQMRSQRRKGDF